MANGITVYSYNDAKDLRRRYMDEGYLNAKILSMRPGEWKVVRGYRETPVIKPEPLPVLSARERLAEEQLREIERIRAMEPSVQSLKFPILPTRSVKIPVKVTREAAESIQAHEQRRVKDALAMQEYLLSMYGTEEGIKSKAPKSEYEAWKRAKKAVEEGGRMGYTSRGIIVIGQRTSAGTGELHRLGEGVAQSWGRRVDVVGGMKKSIPRARPGARTVFGAGSEQPPAITEFGKPKIAQAPGMPKIAGQLDISKLRDKRYE